MLSRFRGVQLCATLWTVARQVPLHGILQARIQEWVADSSALGSIFLFSVLVGDCLVAKLCLTFVTPWTVAHQAPLHMGFYRQEY